jgi:hypothetical protein
MLFCVRVPVVLSNLLPQTLGRVPDGTGNWYPLSVGTRLPSYRH